jgi:dienelactone hydrolase
MKTDSLRAPGPVAGKAAAAVRQLVAAGLLCAASLTLAAPAPGERISFVSCPVVRDTPSVPCWLSDYEGSSYYLTIQSDVSAVVQPPMLGHKVLVEGIVSDKPAICGGVVLDEVRLSVMPERDANCDTILPADPRYVVDFNPRPPGPSAGRLAFDPTPDSAQTAPAAPTGPQTVELHFDFDKAVSFRHPGALVGILELAQQIGAARMQITGMRGAHLLSDGTVLQESADIGQRRAEQIAGLLQGAGLALDTTVMSRDGLDEADGIADWQSRRVTILLEPGEASVVSYSDAALPTHTLYHPATLEGRLPVVLWGNGSCVASNFGYREFLNEVAAQGFIVVALGAWRDSPPPRQQRPSDPAQWPPFETQPEQLLQGLDWIAAQDLQVGSILQGHVDSTRVAVMGHSCGGMQSIKVSPDPRISTTLVLNSGVFPEGDQYNARFGVDRTILAQLHAPVAYFIGGETDIAYVNAEQDWLDLQQLPLPAINANLDVGHGATYSQPRGGAFAEGPIAWLRWQLLDDAAAAGQFVGENCGFCRSETWSLRRHQLPVP